MAKYIKRSWGNDLVLDRNFLITLIIVASMLISIAFVLVFVRGNICLTHDPQLIIRDKAYYVIWTILGFMEGPSSSSWYSIPSC